MKSFKTGKKLLFCMFLLTIVFFTNACHFTQNGMELENLTGDYKEKKSYTISPDNIKTIDTSWIAGEVSVSVWSQSDIKLVEYAQRDLKEKEFLSYTVENNCLSIAYRSPDNTNRKIPPKKVEIFLPENFSANLECLQLDAIFAAISVNGVSCEQIILSTVSGNQSLQSLSSSDAQLETTSGDITIADCNSTALNLQSISGKQSIDSGICTSFSAASTSGDMDISNIKSESMIINTVSGTLYCSNIASSSTDFSTTSGNITVKQGELGNTNFYSISGDIMTQGDFTGLKAESSSGILSFESGEMPDSLDITSTSGDVTLTLPNQEIRLQTKSTSGTITCDLPVITTENGFTITTISGDIQVLHP